jgi:hypothetical protein
VFTTFSRPKQAAKRDRLTQTARSSVCMVGGTTTINYNKTTTTKLPTTKIGCIFNNDFRLKDFFDIFLTRKNQDFRLISRIVRKFSGFKGNSDEDKMHTFVSNHTKK